MSWLVRLGSGLIVCLVLPQLICAQSEEDSIDTIERFVEALGGRIIIESIESLEVKVEFTGGGERTGLIRYLDGMSRRDIELNPGGGKTSHGFDGKNWWRDGTIIRDESMVEAYACVYYFPTEPLQWLKQPERFEVASKEEYADGDLRVAFA